MEIWATVTDGNGDLGDDGLWKFYSAFYSTDGGVIQGNLIPALAPTGPEAEWGKGQGADAGLAADLDGDGDMDVGSDFVGDAAPPWFQAKHSTGDVYYYDDFPIPEVSPLYPIPPFDHPSPEEVEEWKIDHATNEWKVALLYFMPDPADWGPDHNPAGQSGATEIWAAPRQFGTAIWMEDGVSKVNFVHPDPLDPCAGDLESGDKVVLGIASTAHGPGGGPVELGPGGGDVVLDGSASTGSINWWAWDFDGDGNPEIEGIGESNPTISYALLSGMDIADGAYTATMTVGWSASDPVNTSTTTFGLTLVPEPATVALLAVGLVTLIRRRK